MGVRSGSRPGPGCRAPRGRDPAQFRLRQQPTCVAHIVPSSGPSGGGNVAISAHSFVNATKVTFRTKLATNVNVTAPTRITATAPAGSGSVHVCVTTAAESARPSRPTDHLCRPADHHRHQSVARPSARYLGVDHGTHLSRATAVKFGTESATCSWSTPPPRLAPSPPRSSGTVDVKVTTAGGIITATAILTLPHRPSLTSVRPAGSAGGTLVSITGAHFSGATAVLLAAHRPPCWW